jgi:hypothetical protein
VFPTRTVRIFRVWISGAWVFEFINRCQIWVFEFLRISELLLLVFISKPSKNWQFSSENWKRTHSWLFQNLQRTASFHQRTGKGKVVIKVVVRFFSESYNYEHEEPP